MNSDITSSAVFALLACVLALGIAMWFKRPAALSMIQQAWGARTKKQLTVVERTALTSNHMLHLIRFQGNDIVVATTPSNLVVLSSTGISKNTSSFAAAFSREVGE